MKTRKETCYHCRGKCKVWSNLLQTWIVCHNCNGKGEVGIKVPIEDDPWKDHLIDLGDDPLGHQHNNPLK